MSAQYERLFMDGRALGRTEGHKESHNEATEAFVRRMLAKGCDDATILELADANTELLENMKIQIADNPI